MNWRPAATIHEASARRGLDFRPPLVDERPITPQYLLPALAEGSTLTELTLGPGHTIVRIDVIGSTKRAREVIEAGGRFHRVTLETYSNEALTLQALLEASAPTLSQEFHLIEQGIREAVTRGVKTPAELIRREVAEQTQISSSIASVMASTTSALVPLNLVSYATVAGDSIEAIVPATRNSETSKQVQALMIYLIADLARSRGINNLQIRLAAERISWKNQAKLLIEDTRRGNIGSPDGRILGVSGSIFPIATQAEQMAANLDLSNIYTYADALEAINHYHYGDKRGKKFEADQSVHKRNRNRKAANRTRKKGVLNQGQIAIRKELAEESEDFKLAPYQDIAFVTSQQEVTNILFDTDIQESNLALEFKFQAQIERILNNIKYKNIKYGPIKFYEKGGKRYIDLYFITTREDRRKSSARGHLHSMQELYKLARARGIILNIAATEETVAVGNWHNGRFQIEGDVNGHIPNLLSRLSCSIEGGGGVIVDDAFIYRLNEEGFVFLNRTISGSKVELKGIGNKKVYMVENGQTKRMKLSREIDNIETFEDLEEVMKRILSKHFDEKIGRIATKEILDAIFTYANTDEVKETLDNAKRLFISILSRLEQKEHSLGRILAVIVENSLRLDVSHEKLAYLIDQDHERQKHIGNSPRRSLVYIYKAISCTVFGRLFDCKLSTILAITGCEIEDIVELERHGLISLEFGKGSRNRRTGKIIDPSKVYIKPDPHLSIRLYTEQAEKERERFHQEVTKYLFEKKSWGELKTQQEYIAVRSFLLHFIYDGRIEKAIFEEYCDIAVNALDFMFTNRYYSDLASLMDPLLAHIRNSEKHKDLVDEYEIDFAIALARLDEGKEALRVLSSIKSRDKNLIKRVKLVRKIIRAKDKVDQRLLQEIKIDNPHYYHLIEIIAHNSMLGSETETEIFAKVIDDHLPNTSQSRGKSYRELLGIVTENISVVNGNPEALAILFRFLGRGSLGIINFTSSSEVAEALSQLSTSPKPYYRVLGEAYNFIISNGTAKIENTNIVEIVTSLLISGDYRLAQKVLKERARIVRRRRQRVKEVA